MDVIFFKISIFWRYIFIYFFTGNALAHFCVLYLILFSVLKNTFIYSICFRRYCIWSYFDQLLVNAYLAHTETGKI